MADKEEVKEEPEVKEEELHYLQKELQLSGAMQRVFDTTNKEVGYLIAIDPIVVTEKEWQHLKEEVKLTARIYFPGST